MHLIAKIFFTFCISLISTGLCFSQSPLRLPFNKKISIEDGLSSYNIKKIIQDKYGFIWIATQDGLNRYDGKSFVVYNKSMNADHQLLGIDVWDMEEDTYQGILWVVTSYGGVNGIDLKTGKVCRALPAKALKGLNSDWIRCLKLYKDNLWIGTDDGITVYNIRTKSFERFDSIPFPKSTGINRSINKIFIDKYDNIWLCIANYGIAIYSAEKKNLVHFQSLAKLHLQYRKTFNQFSSVTALPDGDLLIGTDQGFRRFSYSEKGIGNVSTGLFKTSDEFGQIKIETSAIDTLKNVWFSAASKLYKVNINTEIVQEVKDANINVQGDWLNYTDAVYFDKNNNIWLGTSRGVAYTRNTTPLFIPYNVSEDQSSRIDHAYYVYPVNDSVLYAGTENALLKVDLHKNVIVHADMGSRYYFINEHVDKKLLVSNESGFFVYDQRNSKLQNISRIYKELEPLNAISINSIAYATDSLAIIGTETPHGFYIWNYKSKTLDSGKHTIPGKSADNNIVNTCYTDKKNRVWILGDNVISLYHPLTRETKTVSLVNPVSKAPYDIYFDVAEAKGYFWIAAYGTGLIQVDSNFIIKKIFSTNEGLSNTGVYKIFPLNDSLIFVSTNNGLSVLHHKTGVFSNYYQQDGLHSNSFEENCGVYKNGRIYVGGVNGFTIIDPENLSTNTISPQLYVSSVKVETNSGLIESSDLFLNSLQIPNSVLQTTAYFSALNFINPSRTTFAYRIKELDTGWVKLGTQHFVNLIGLNPGKYTLEVKSANEDEVWNKDPLSLSLVFMPKWYQTLVFKLCVILLIAGAIYALYRYRISQLKQQQQIRIDIAGDLHDDIGSTLNTVKVLTHLAKREPDKTGHLNQIERSIAEAITGLKDIIWVMDDSQDTVDYLIERIKKFALPVALAKGIQFECLVESDVRNLILAKTEKRNIYMIVKETINNSIKYAECSNIKLLINRFNHRIAISVEDDGKGFNLSQISPGNGLKNINYRANQIHYSAEVISVLGKGTAVKLAKI